MTNSVVLRRFTLYLSMFVNVALSVNKILVINISSSCNLCSEPIHRIVHDFENHCHTLDEMRYGRDEICWNGVFAEHFVN